MFENASVVGEYRDNAQMHVEAIRWFSRRVMAEQKRGFTFWNASLFFVCVCYALAIYMLISSGSHSVDIGPLQFIGWSAWLVASLPGFALLLILYLQTFIRSHVFYKTLAEGFAPQQIRLCLLPDGLFFNGDRRKFYWSFSEIKSVESYLSGYAIMSSSSVAYVPRDAFTSIEAAESFCQTIRIEISKLKTPVQNGATHEI